MNMKNKASMDAAQRLLDMIVKSGLIDTLEMPAEDLDEEEPLLEEEGLEEDLAPDEEMPEEDLEPEEEQMPPSLTGAGNMESIMEAMKKKKTMPKRF